MHSHRGYDKGALKLGQELADMLQAAFFAATVSRLLIDLNRSIGHPKLYSSPLATGTHATIAPLSAKGDHGPHIVLRRPRAQRFPSASNFPTIRISYPKR